MIDHRSVLIIMFLTICFSVLLYACQKSKDIYSLKYTVHDWTEIDSDLKEQFVSNQKLLYDLDLKKEIEVTRTGIEGLIPGKEKFTYKNTEFFLRWNHNKEVHPFLIKDGNLWIVYNENSETIIQNNEKILSKFKIYKFNLD